MLPCLSLIINSLSSPLLLPSQYNTCSANCSCVSTTITCNNTIPDAVPDNIVQVVLVDPTRSVLPPGRFCNVTWDKVRKLVLLFPRLWPFLYDHVFDCDCLDQLQTIKISGFWSSASKQLFYGLTNVTVLDLSDSYIESYDLTTWFSDRSLLPKLSHFNLSMNHYRLAVDQAVIDALSSRPLELLDLSHQFKLTFDFENSGEICKTLNTLILHDSTITVINLPKTCHSLQFVDLSGNQELANGLKQCVDSFYELPIHSFYYARVVYLDRLITDSKGYHTSNCRVYIGDVSFVAANAVRELFFTNNYIPEFEILFNCLYVGNALDFISLSHNNIKAMNKNAFFFLQSLQKIDLSYNNLNQMPDLKGTFQVLFRHNQNLRSIDLSSNGLSYLPGETFLSNSNLTEIHLSHNTFKQLSLNVSYLHELSVLNLRFNEIQYLDPRSRQNVERLYKNHERRQQLDQRSTPLQVLLEGNPFTCSCEALEFLQWFVESPIFNSSYTCDLDGRKIPITELAVHAASEECERPKRRRRTIVLSTLLPAVAIAAIVTAVTIQYRRYRRRLVQRQLEDRLQLIQEENTGCQYTVFLSYSSLDTEFVVSIFESQWR